MNEMVLLVRAGGVGLLLGALFFGGLWWTVQKGLSSKRPALWFAGSLLVRTGMVVAGFYVAAGGRWERLLACLLGFVMARVIITLRLRSTLCPRASAMPAGRARAAGPPAEPSTAPARETSHAS